MSQANQRCVNLIMNENLPSLVNILLMNDFAAFVN